MPYDWSALVKHRLRVSKVLGVGAPLIGHADLRKDLVARLDGADTASLLLLTGSSGSGKSAVLRWLQRTAAGRVVDARSAVLTHRLDPEGDDVERLIRELREPVEAVGDRAVLVYHKIDDDLLQEGVGRFVARAIADLDVGFLVLTMATPLASQVFPIPPTQVGLEHRRASQEETDHFITAYLGAADAPTSSLSKDLRLAIHDLSEQTPDFRAVQFVVEMMLAKRMATHQQSRIEDLHDLLASQEVASLRLPAIRGTEDHRLSFRRKDKTELLAEVLRRHFSTPDELAEAAVDVQGFDRAAFLTDSAVSFPDAVLSLCLTSSPLDLVLQLLGPTQIREEIKNLGLDPSHLFRGEARAHLLIRGLGFTLISTPQGLNVFTEAVRRAADLMADPEPRLDVVNSAAQQVVQHVEYALRDLAHFWGAFFFGSLEQAVREHNQQIRSPKPLKVSKLGTGQMVGLLRFFNAFAEQEEAAFRLQTLRMDRPISTDLLTACERYVPLRNSYEHPGGSLAAALPTSPAPDALVQNCRSLIKAALLLLRYAGEGSFPVVIKLSEIVFDEYSRRIFRAVDADDNELRFTITDEAITDSLVVADHYYLLPRRRISINPHIVPRAGMRNPILFSRAEAYDRASATQRQQTERLFSLIDVGPRSSIVDVGCGTGRDALRLASQFPAGKVRGIDISPDMLRLARARAEAHRVPNVDFEEVGLLSYQPDDRADLVFSSSTMHWIRPPEPAYQRLFSLLRPGGQLAVHQGGYDTYRGLHTCARAVIAMHNLTGYFEGWPYPAFYPTASELEELLGNVGFRDVRVESVPSTGAESPTLVEDFSQAGLLPYLQRLPEADRDLFRRAFLAEAHHHPPDLYTHRLYVSARRP